MHAAAPKRGRILKRLSPDGVLHANELIVDLRRALGDMTEAILAVDRAAYLKARSRWVKADIELQVLLPEG